MADRVIDFHRHLLPPRDLVPATGPHVRDHGGREVIWADGRAYRTVDERLRGVGLDGRAAVYSAAPVGAAFDAHGDYIHRLNTFLAEMTRGGADQWYFGSLPFGDESAALEELDRLAHDDRCLGVLLLAGHHDWVLRTAADSHLVHALGESRLRIFLHPYDDAVPECDRIATFGVGMPYATARTVVTLMSCPDAYAAVGGSKWLLAHGGGALPSIADRIAQGHRGGLAPSLAVGPHEFLAKACWADTAVYGPAGWAASRALFGEGRHLYGTDAPFLRPPEFLQPDLPRLAGEFDQAADEFMQGVS